MSELPSLLEKHIEVTEVSALAIDILSAELPFSKQKIKQIMQKGAVWQTIGKQTHRIRRAKKKVKKGDALHVYYDENVLAKEPNEPILISDEGQYSVWSKPYGLLSQGSKWGDHCTITRWAEQHLQPQRNSFVVHRLDRAANGLIVIAHEKKAAAALSALFQQRVVSKRYQITVQGEFDSSASQENPITVNHDIDERHAISHFHRISYDAKAQRSVLDVSIETGRKHQIRRHSASLGFPVIGDRLYGSSLADENLQLTAYYLAFKCPFSGRVKEFDISK